MVDETEYKNRCACGWEILGDLDTVVDATIDHGRRIHNMEATREQVLVVVLADRGDAPADNASRVSA